jgi:hypothetical protein
MKIYVRAEDVLVMPTRRLISVKVRRSNWVFGSVRVSVGTRTYPMEFYGRNVVGHEAVIVLGDSIGGFRFDELRDAVARVCGLTISGLRPVPNGKG